MVKLRAALTERLREVTDDAAFEANVILETVLGRDYRVRELTSGLLPNPEQLGLIEKMLDRRLAGEPLQYIVGEWEFYGLSLYVGPGVLIPRQDTETLVETALKLTECVSSPKVLDLCSGSGCVALAYKSARPDADVTALELSGDAYDYLCLNCARYGGVTSVLADALDADVAAKYCSLDLITANPPYLTAADMAVLQREVRFEPQIALYGDLDGLKFYRKIPELWRGSLREGGTIALEIGAAQGEAVSKLLEEGGWREVSVGRDLAGKTRVVSARK